MKAFVTGGSGFLGINLIKQLVEKGWQVTAVHRASSSLADLKSLEITLVEASLLDKQQLRNVIPDQIDAIFHIAGDTNMWFKNNDRQYQTNVTATQNLVDVAIEKHVGRFIHTSSVSAYGFHKGTITEDTKSTAMTSGVNYLKTKYLGEQVVKKAVAERGLDAVCLNPCAIIGPYDRGNWSQLFTMIQQGTLPGVPAGEGSYCHVREVAAAHIAAFEQGQKGENYLLAGTDSSFLNVVKKIGILLDKQTPNKTLPTCLIKTLGFVSNIWSFITNKEPNITPEKALMVTKRVVAKSEKAKSELNYVDNIEIDEMLKDCFDWMKLEKLI